MKNIIKNISFLLVIPAALGACSKETNSPSAQMQNSQAIIASQINPAQQVISNETIAITDASTLIFSYWAMATVPVDYQEIGGLVSKKYASERNEFKKDEILQSLKPQIDQEIAKYKSYRHFKIDTGLYTFRPGEYDYQYKFFPINGVEDGSTFYFDAARNYRLKFNNGSSFSKLRVDDKEVVDRINKLIAKFEIAAVIYYDAEGDAIGDTIVNAKITKIDFVDKNKNVVATVQ